ncbi:hypothetical protein PanWU01x14_202560, partial [Parasponia andersonii]
NGLFYKDFVLANKNNDPPRKLISQYDNTESKIMSVFVIRTTSLEEQLQELRRMLAKKEAEIECLTTQLAEQVNKSKQKKVEVGQILIASMTQTEKTQGPTASMT